MGLTEEGKILPQGILAQGRRACDWELVSVWPAVVI